jgi:hypothetical protein
LFVANFDTEKVLERSLGVTKQSTVILAIFGLVILVPPLQNLFAQRQVF